MITQQEFREIMSNFATGVTVVSTIYKSKPYGLTVNSFTSVSLNPPLILICIKKGGKAYDAISSSSFFCVNVLSKEQKHLSERFADPSIEDRRFDGVEYELDEYGCINIKHCLAYITCENFREYEGGDHGIFLAKVVKMRKGEESKPLIFFKRNYYTINSVD